MALAAVLALGAGGCGRDPIFIAEISDAGVDAAPILCTLSDAGTGIGCPDGSFCEFSEATKCKRTEGTEGTCAPIPSDSCANDLTFAPQCGCDSITYFNECLRRAKGVSTASATTCDLQGVFLPKYCDPTRPNDPDCPTCAVILPEISMFLRDAGTSAVHEECAFFPSNAGTCWVTPACTPKSPASGSYLYSCSAQRCEDACLAVRANGPVIPCVPGDAGPD